MSRPVIRSVGIGKQYRRGLGVSRGLLRDVLARSMRSPLSVFRRATEEPFWALRNVSFEVNDGEVLGLIGRNGSGKTTLLRILSRITRPTEGRAQIRGRVGSLLEVGTGFHPELTGRENTFLSGAILGMSKKEITRKFDEIVSFAELEKFIDTPVKHYSSGMYVRLAFAVAAYLEPEILLVDEVLAVGDMNFQKKCLGKMGEVAKGGRTVVLVSHSMAAINALCSRCIILSSGAVDFDGATTAATTRYYEQCLSFSNSGDNLLDRPRIEGNGKARFSSVAIRPLNRSGGEAEAAYPGCDLEIDVNLDCVDDFTDCNLAIIFYDSNGYRVIDTNTAQKGQFVSLKSGEKGHAQFLLRDVLLRPGTYFVGLWLGRIGIEAVDHVEHAISVDVIQVEDNSKHPVTYPGIYLCRFENRFKVK